MFSYHVQQITQDQDTLSEDLGTMFPNTVEEPSQSDLEAELSNIMEPDYVSPRLPLDTSDLDLEKELEDILKDESSQDDKELSGLLNGNRIIFVLFFPSKGIAFLQFQPIKIFISSPFVEIDKIGHKSQASS